MNELAERIRAAMTPPYTDMCYAASEAYYHLAGGRAAGITKFQAVKINRNGNGLRPLRVIEYDSREMAEVAVEVRNEMETDERFYWKVRVV